MEENNCVFNEEILKIENVHQALVKTTTSLFQILNLENIDQAVYWNLDHYFEFNPQQFVFIFLLNKKNTKNAWQVANDIQVYLPFNEKQDKSYMGYVLECLKENAGQLERHKNLKKLCNFLEQYFQKEKHIGTNADDLLVQEA